METKNLIGQNTNYVINGFANINDIGNISETFLNDIARSFNRAGYYKEVLKNGISFSGKQFYNYGDDIFMFEYSSLDELKQDSISWKNKFKKKNTITSETIEGKQVLESSGYFEFDGKFYLLGLLYQDLNEYDNNEEKGIYKGVIINPSKYFVIEHETDKIVGKVKGIIKYE